MSDYTPLFPTKQYALDLSKRLLLEFENFLRRTGRDRVAISDMSEQTRLAEQVYALCSTYLDGMEGIIEYFQKMEIDRVMVEPAHILLVSESIKGRED